MGQDDLKCILDRDQLPKKWYNILPDLPTPPAPPLNPATGEPAGPEDLAPIFPMNLIGQEVSMENYIDIPEELLDLYVRLGRGTPMQRAVGLEKMLKTPAKIYYKREDMTATGSHKINTALAQAYYNREAGVEKLTTETGAGQWGSALALATKMFGLECEVFMVRASFDQKPGRKIIMNTFGAKVHASPSDITEVGKKIVAENPDAHRGSLGIAISEALELAVKDEKTKYSLGSVLNHVMLHQTVIGQEVIEQFKQMEVQPDYMIGCVGGGSNFAGFALPMIGEKLKGRNNVKFLAVEPSSVPTVTKGEYRYDFGDSGKMTPKLLMHTLGYDFMPPSIHAGGLRYHGMAPIVSNLINDNIIQTAAYPQTQTFRAGEMFAHAEGIIPAPESCHAIKAAIDLAQQAKETGEEKVIAFNLSGHGLLDLGGYDIYHKNELVDYVH